jgi:hypothetical protein
LAGVETSIEKLDIDGSIVLKWVKCQYFVGIWALLNWLGIQIIGRKKLKKKTHTPSGLHKIKRNFYELRDY